MIYDAIVVGLGAVGSAALYQLSGKTANVLGLDQFAPPHTLGSTHGDTRITRQAIGEGPYFVPLALRSYEIWRELEQRSGEELLTITGGLFVGQARSDVRTHNKPGWLATTIRAADQFGIAHELLDTDTLRQRFPQIRFSDGEVGYLEENAGWLRPERCVAVQLELARQNGATVRLNERMLSFASTDQGVTVQTDQGTYQARKVVLTTGSWIAESLRDTPYQDLLKVHRQVLYWFDIPHNHALYTPDRLPVFILSDRDVYGFPAGDGPGKGIKIATESYVATVAPDAVNRTITEAETQKMYEQYIAPNFVGIGPDCIRSVVCLYTMTPNGDFIIDRHPAHPDVLLASACSGHGFKHSAAVGQILAELAIDGRTGFEIRPFSLSQFVPIPG